MPAPPRGRNSGGYQRDTPSAGTGSPRRSVGASCERRTSIHSRLWAPATWATMLDLPIPGGPQIIVLIFSGAGGQIDFAVAGLKLADQLGVHGRRRFDQGGHVERTGDLAQPVAQVDGSGGVGAVSAQEGVRIGLVLRHAAVSQLEQGTALSPVYHSSARPQTPAPIGARFHPWRGPGAGPPGGCSRPPRRAAPRSAAPARPAGPRPRRPC